MMILIVYAAFEIMQNHALNAGQTEMIEASPQSSVTVMHLSWECELHQGQQFYIHFWVGTFAKDTLQFVHNREDLHNSNACS